MTRHPRRHLSSSQLVKSKLLLPLSSFQAVTLISIYKIWIPPFFSVSFSISRLLTREYTNQSKVVSFTTLFPLATCSPVNTTSAATQDSSPERCIRCSAKYTLPAAQETFALHWTLDKPQLALTQGKAKIVAVVDGHLRPMTFLE